MWEGMRVLPCHNSALLHRGPCLTDFFGVPHVVGPKPRHTLFRIVLFLMFFLLSDSALSSFY